MSPYRSLRRAFTAVLLLALFLASAPARAQPARSPLSWKAAVLGESALTWVWERLARLWGGEMAKEGMSIDPNGQPQGQTSDEGPLIDPDG
jgi:hypothetical protein